MVRVKTPLVSTLLVPTTALAVALGPALGPAGTPSAATPPAVPVVHVEAIQLAGIGQNIYNAITPVVQYVVGGVSYLINFLPFGGIVAAQINIDYFQGIQPAVAATVDYAAAVLRDPLDFFPITKTYVNTLVGIQYDLVSAQLRFLGFNELPPRPVRSQARVAAAAAASSALPGDAAAPVIAAEQAAAPAVTTVTGRTDRPARARARDEARSPKSPTVRPAAAAERGTRAKPERQARAAASKRAAASS